MRILIAILSLAFMQPAIAQSCPESDSAQKVAISKEAGQCVRVNARRLAKSNQRPSDIAIAAMSACEGKMMQLRSLCSTRERFVSLIEGWLNKQAIAAVVEARAK